MADYRRGLLCGLERIVGEAGDRRKSVSVDEVQIFDDDAEKALEILRKDARQQAHRFRALRLIEVRLLQQCECFESVGGSDDFEPRFFEDSLKPHRLNEAVCADR